MASQAHQTVQNNLQVPHPNHYRNSRNLQQPADQIRVAIPLHLIQEKQPVEITINGHRRNGHIQQKVVLPQPMMNPATKEVAIGKITIQYTDGQKELKYYQMLSIQANNSNHLRGDYHFHFIPNSKEDIALANYNNSMNLQNPLQFSPHSTTTNVDEGTRHQFQKMCQALQFAEKTISESKDDAMDKALLHEVYSEHIKMLNFARSNSSDVYNFVTAMRLINKVNQIQQQAIIQKNKNSHALLGNVQLQNTSKSETTNNSQSNSNASQQITSIVPPPQNNPKPIIAPPPQNKAKYKCPFKNICSKEYKKRSSLNIHLPNHSSADNYETILSFPCAVENCNARFESQKYLDQHIAGKHSTAREKLLPQQNCPKCVVFKGTANSGYINKGCYKNGGFTKVYCSLDAKECGFTQKIKPIGHIYTYTQRRKNK